ncbi:MAG: hypothetical protein JWN32_2292, partial [Solirubrobacterales bacterium]|nr:hypothetical protein [Solirubrobacterales bacterium]
GVKSFLLRSAATSKDIDPLAGETASDEGSFRAIGDRLFALVDEARLLRVDPELALRDAARRFRDDIGDE